MKHQPCPQPNPNQPYEQPTPKPLERRSAKLAVPGGAPVIEGYAVRFGERSVDLGGFVEVIDRGAFSNALKAPEREVLAFWNHDLNLPLARRSNGSLQIAERPDGLAVRIAGDRTSWAADAAASVEAGTVQGMSFGFACRQDRWERTGGDWVRTVLDADLLEVSLTPVPAYPTTTAHTTLTA